MHTDNILRVAMVGSGPGGLFTAEELLLSKRPVQVTVFEKCPLPYGLVRYGVAPDHPITKRVSKLFERTLARPGITLKCGVEVGRDVALADLQREFDVVVLATGAEDDRLLGIPGESLPGLYPSLTLAEWFNGHPDHARDLIELDSDTAIIIGHGNVALDMARMLAVQPDSLQSTDIAPHALEVLRRSRIQRILIVGRRGPANTRFGSAEIVEIGNIAGCSVSAEWPDNATLPEQADDRQKDVFAALQDFAKRPVPAAGRHIRFLFNRVPAAILGTKHVTGVEFRKSPGATLETLPTELVIKSIGHQAAPMAGLPFDPVKGVIPCTNHRIAPGLYAVGWVKRGATGLIGHNRRDAMDTVKAILSDFPAV